MAIMVVIRIRLTSVYESNCILPGRPVAVPYRCSFIEKLKICNKLVGNGYHPFRQDGLIIKIHVRRMAIMVVI